MVLTKYFYKHICTDIKNNLFKKTSIEHETCVEYDLDGYKAYKYKETILIIEFWWFGNGKNLRVLIDGKECKPTTFQEWRIFRLLSKTFK